MLLIFSFIWLSVSHLNAADKSAKVTACNMVQSNHAKDIYHFKAYKFGFFNVFSRLQIYIESSRHLAVYSSQSKADLIKAMKAEEASYLGKMLLRAMGTFSDGSNYYGNETRFEVSPFTNNFIGFSVTGEDNVAIVCNFTVFDVKLLALFLIGTLVYFFAESFSRNAVFYYASGVTIGLLMSWMIVLILIIKLIPYKKSIVGVAVFGGSFGLYLTQSFLLNLQFYAKYHFYWLLWYSAIVSVFSLAFLYYKGPPSNVRFLNLAKYCMQLLGLLCIYNCTWTKEVAVTLVVFTIATHLMLLKFDFSCFVKRWTLNISQFPFTSNCQPQKRRLLTEEEYRMEAQRETAKALKELREYCSSPEIDTWRIVQRLNDPKRFSSFIETGKMCNEEELAAYEEYEPEEGDESWVSNDDEEEFRHVKVEKLEEGCPVLDESIYVE